MSQSGLVVVKQEITQIDAQNVAAFLQSRGLRAVVNADDAGGTIPSMDETRGIQILVPAADAEKARRLLAQFDEGRGEVPDEA